MKNFTRAIVLLFIICFACLPTQAAVFITETHVNSSCNGGTNGSIDLTISGGSAPYTYLWNGGANTQDRTNITAGVYTVTVSDFFGVSATAAVTITEPTAITDTKAITNVACGGGNTGAVDLTPAGGTPGYTYLWNDGITTEDRTGLTAANYYFTITDSRGCTKVDSANVTQPPGMVLSKTTTNVTCGSGANGAINLTVSFGVPGYTYLWNDGALTEDRTGIAAGNYSVVVTDASGCSASMTATVGQSGSGMVVNANTTQPSCNGGNNGAITVTSVVGSVGPYTFAWSDGPHTQNRTGLTAGPYTVTATSTTGCTAATTINLAEPPALTVVLTPITLSCFGSNNGAINTTASGGTPAYSYHWADGVFTRNRTALSSGTYVITVTDSKGCTVSESAFVPEPITLTLVQSPSPLACTGGPTGNVSAVANGGTEPYSYWWGGGVVTSSITNVNSGTYCVTVTDSHGCTVSACATVPVYNPMTSTATGTNVICNGASTGAISLTPSNGTLPYSYSWSNGAVVQNPSSLPAGTYTVTISDSHPCTVTQTVTLTQPPFAMTVNPAIVDPTCNGSTNGTINITVSNGVSPYTYNWGGAIVTQNRTGLAAGIYNVTATDNNSCTVSSSITVNQPTPISVTPTVTNATCFGSSTGAINLTVTGSFAPYTYAWNGGTITQNRTGLTAGNYTVTVTDNHSCSGTSSATINQPAAGNIGVTAGNLTCNGVSTGWINLSVSGGTAPYSYNWGGGVVTQNRTALAAGTYTVTVQDNVGCPYTASAVINQPPPISITSVITNASCFGGNNGAIILTVSGGTSPYTFNWGGPTSQNRTNLGAGTYTVTVTDASGCTAAHNAMVGQGTALSITPNVTNVSCNGGNNGAIALTVTGATAPYTYNWGGIFTPNRTGLTAGSYNVTVTDNLGCTASNITSVTQPSAIAVTSTVSNATCFGGSNGSIIIGVSGGTSPYSFNWGGAVVTQNRNSIPAGNYTVTVTDNANCTATNSSVVGQGVAIVVSPVVTNVSCNGGSNGAINITVSNGATPYSFNWGGAVVTQNRTGLSQGTYTVTVTDNSNCTATNSSTVNQPTTITASSTTTNVACNGGNNGAITLTVSGGTSPYTYDWGGIFTQNRTNLTAGSYTVTITDNAGCTGTHTATISQTTSLSVSSTVTNVSCPGGTNGAINITVTGGTTPYSFNWGGAVVTQNRINLSAGSYTVSVTDNSNCIITNTAIVTQPNAIAIVPTVTNVACAGGNTGAINIAVSGGTAPYTYNWGGAVVTQNRVNIPAGNYAVTVTDNAGCSASIASTVIQSASLTVSPVVTNITCSGGTNGAISITATGGTAPYGFNWGGIFTQNRTNLSQGSYTVTVTDNAGCSGVSTSSVLQPIALTITPLITNVSCNGGNNGAITITPNGGTAPYTFNWTGNIATQNRTGLSMGTYGVTVTDNNSCTANTNLTVNQPLPIALSTTKVDVACFGAATGSINLTVTGGNSPYSFVWSNAAQTQNISGLVANSYNVTVTDGTTCTASTTTSITQATQISTSISTVNATCFGWNSGSIDLTVSGGTGVYTYLWSNTATTQDISSVVANTYTVTIRDANNCTVNASATITQPAQIVLTATKANVSCNGGTNGSIDLTVNGGASPFVYAWSNTAITQDISNLAAATYSVTVNDNNACSVSTSVSVTQPAALLITPTQTNVSCNGGNNGIITTTVSGGTGPYSYNWGGGFITANRTNLSAGNYTLTVNDANNCTASSTTTITQPVALAITFVKTDVVCNGAASGSIDVTVNGGTAPYVYNWNNNTIAQDLWNVTAGNYSLTVTDANGCSSSIAASITQPVALTVSLTHTDVSCFGGNNGTISAIATGGTGTYTFAWDNGGTTPVINNLIAGTYTLLLTDAANCATTLSTSVMQPAVFAATETHTNVLCNGTNTGAINLTVTGGAPGFTYAWSNGAVTQDISNLAIGNFSVVVTDANSCSTSLSTSITQPSVLTASATATNVICNGANTGSVALTVSGGTNPYTYQWSNNTYAPNLLNTGAGNYSVTIIDGNACTTVTSATITQPSAIIVTLTKTDNTCFGNTNGSITTNVNGGAGGYSFNWSNSATTPNISNLAAATYTLTVHDASNCPVVSSATITQPSAMVIGETHTNVSCNGGSNASINLSVSGGAGNYSYAWSNSAVSQNLNSLNANNYTVTVSDVNGCSSSKSIAITQPAVLALSETHTPYACATHAGAIDLTVSGGTTPYAYNWTNTANTEDINNLSSGSYTVVVTDANSCTATTGATITALATLSSSVTHTDVLCNGASTGAVNVSVSGGTAPFNYNWTNGASTSNLNNIAAGNYSVVITDANNCSLANTTVVSQPVAIAVNPSITNVNCFGKNTGAINLSATGGVSPYSFAWNNAATVSALSSLTAGNYAVTITDANNCSTALTSLAVTEPTQLVVTSTIIPVGCSNHDDGEIHEFASGGIPPYVYQWMNSHLDKDLINLPTGNYMVTVTDNNGCKVNKVDVVGMAPPIDITAAVKNVACVQVENGAIDLTATGGTPAYHFHWSNGETTSALRNLAQGQYTVTVSDSRSCSAQANYTITYDYDLQIDATNTTTINMGESIQLTVSANVDHSNVYSWTPLQNVICSNCQTTEVVPTFTTHYTVTAIDANGCKAVDTLTVNVNSITDIFIPNAFSPNGDGNNDVLQLYGDLNTMSFVDFMVFDRWGEKVFESNNANFTWDGTYKGELVPPGAYIYTMKAVFINGYSRPDYKGSITVLK